MEEKNRKLTEAEKRRLAHFEEVKEAHIRDGYAVKELTIGIVKANVYAILMALPLCLVTVIPFIWVNRGKLYFEGNPLISMVLYVIVLKLLSYKSGAADVLIYDHPTQAGSVIFER